MSRKKPQFATEADVEKIKSELEERADRAKQSGEKAAENVRADLTAQLNKLSDAINNNAAVTKSAQEDLRQDLQKFCKQKALQAQNEVEAQLPPITESIAALQADLIARLEAQDAELKNLFQTQLQTLVESLEEEIANVKEELEDKIEEFGRAAAEHSVQQRHELDAAIEKVRKDSVARDDANKLAAEKEMAKIVEDQKKADENQNDRNERAQTEIWLRLDRLNDLITENKDGANEHTTAVEEKAAASLQEFREDAEKRLANLDVQTEKLHDAVAEVENISTRRVDWVIKNVSKRLRPPSASKACLHSSWFSPKFDVAGAHGVQLELQLFKAADPPVEGEAAGDCAAFLWACKGMNLVYKLYIGSKSAQLEKVFNGRVPYGTKRLCWLKDQINREEDSLRVSVEILEAVREIEHPIKPPPPPEEVEGEEVQVDERSKPLEGKVVFRRHLNHRLVDQVRSYVETVRSQMVRRVEWRLENALMLRRCFPPGEPMCSVAFAAAGVDNLQLLFYPCGYHGVTDGFCSFFLYAPAGATMKFTLYAGSHRRDATHFFEDQGAFGRSNFCRFDSIVEEDTDSIFLALEIDEAHQDVVSKVAHPLVQPGDRRTQGQIDGAVPKAVESVVKMHRAPNKPPNAGLEEKRVLPSLWTAKSLGEQRGSHEPMRGFDELRQTKNLDIGNSKRLQLDSPSSPISPLAKTKSSPNLTKDFSNTTAPLPALAKTGGTDFAASIGSKKVRGGSRTRTGGSNTMQVLQPAVVH